MRWFKKRELKPERYELYEVTIPYKVLVNAKNPIHAVNTVRELRNDLYQATKPYVLKLSIMEETPKVRKC